MANEVSIEVVQGDALDFEADVLALKHAQGLFGIDEAAAGILEKAGQRLRFPAPGDFLLAKGAGGLGAAEVLFVGVPDLPAFGYQQIRRFGHRVLSSLAEQRPKTRHVAVTIHGPGYGLDAVEAFASEVAGLVDATQNGEAPRALAKISFVERNAARAERLRDVLEELLPDGTIPSRREPAQTEKERTRAERLRAAGYASDAKDHIFVAMPFKEEMDDTYHYGIEGAVQNAGYVCERADLAVFTGDVLQWVKKRIQSATLLIADLTDANPNVYLEVGYAWGCGVRTVLVVRVAGDDDLDRHLKFDVQGQRCLPYKSIQQLEKLLANELANLR